MVPPNLRQAPSNQLFAGLVVAIGDRAPEVDGQRLLAGEEIEAAIQGRTNGKIGATGEPVDCLCQVDRPQAVRGLPPPWGSSLVIIAGAGLSGRINASDTRACRRSPRHCRRWPRLLRCRRGAERAKAAQAWPPPTATRPWSCRSPARPRPRTSGRGQSTCGCCSDARTSRRS